MTWPCPNCLKMNDDEAEYCLCGNRRDYTRMDTMPGAGSRPSMQPEQRIRMMLRRMLEAGTINQRSMDEITSVGLRLGLEDSDLRRLFREVGQQLNFNLRADIELAVEANPNLQAGKTGLLRFHLYNNSRVGYREIELLVSVKSREQPLTTREDKLIFAPGDWRECSVAYLACGDWSEDVITRLYVYLFTADNEAIAYTAAQEIRLPITDPNSNRAINIEVSGHGQLFGDVGAHFAGSFSSTHASKPIPILLQEDPEETERIQRRPRVEATVARATSTTAFDSCCLEMKHNGKSWNVWLISRPVALLGRSAACDVQVYYLDNQGNPVVDICSTVSKRHCRLHYLGDQLALENISGVRTEIINDCRRQQLNAQAVHRFAATTVFNLGALQLEATLFNNYSSQIAESPLPPVITDAQTAWQYYGEYGRPGPYSCVRLRYRNNPYLDDYYLLVYKYARFGSSIKLPLTLPGELPMVTGRFRFQEHRFFIEKLASDYRQFYLDGCPIEAGTAYPLQPDMHITVGPVIMRVEIE